MNDNESLANRLSRLIPNRGAIDRDSLIFAAGRASAGKIRVWKGLVGSLAATQLLTLVFLWPRPVAPAAVGPSSLAGDRPAPIEWLPSDRPAPAASQPSEDSPFELARMQRELLANEKARLRGASNKTVVPHAMGALGGGISQRPPVREIFDEKMVPDAPPLRAFPVVVSNLLN